jgi:hypothetical protein
VLAAVPPRGPTEDVLVSMTHRHFDELPRGARVGTLSGALAHLLLRGAGVEVVLYEGQEEPYRDLAAGRVVRITPRNNRITATQRLTLLNSTQIQRKLEQGPALQTLFRTARPGSWEVVDGLYYAILSRPPTSGERTTVGAYVQAAGKDKRAAAIDLAWALINSPEFLYRH